MKDCVNATILLMLQNSTSAASHKKVAIIQVHLCSSSRRAPHYSWHPIFKPFVLELFYEKVLYHLGNHLSDFKTTEVLIWVRDLLDMKHHRLDRNREKKIVVDMGLLKMFFGMPSLVCKWIFQKSLFSKRVLCNSKGTKSGSIGAKPGRYKECHITRILARLYRFEKNKYQRMIAVIIKRESINNGKIKWIVFLGSNVVQ